MSAPIRASAALLNSRLVSSPPRNPDLVAAYASGAAATIKADRLAASVYGTQHPAAAFGPHGEIARKRRDYDRARSLGRRRTSAGDGKLPPQHRPFYTQGELSALSVIGREVSKTGSCKLTTGAIAARGGVSVRTVQYAVSKAMGIHPAMRDIPADRRPAVLLHVQRRRPWGSRTNLPNVITIIDRDWINWLSYRPSEAPALEDAEEKESRVHDEFAGQLLLSFLGAKPEALHPETRHGAIGGGHDLRSGQLGPSAKAAGKPGCKKVHTTENLPINRLIEMLAAEAGIDISDGWQRLRLGLPPQIGSGRGSERQGRAQLEFGGRRYAYDSIRSRR